jgi:hypothetical protein
MLMISLRGFSERKHLNCESPVRDRRYDACQEERQQRHRDLNRAVAARLWVNSSKGPPSARTIGVPRKQIGATGFELPCTHCLRGRCPLRSGRLGPHRWTSVRWRDDVNLGQWRVGMAWRFPASSPPRKPTPASIDGDCGLIRIRCRRGSGGRRNGPAQAPRAAKSP